MALCGLEKFNSFYSNLGWAWPSCTELSSSHLSCGMCRCSDQDDSDRAKDFSFIRKKTNWRGSKPESLKMNVHMHQSQTFWEIQDILMHALIYSTIQDLSSSVFLIPFFCNRTHQKQKYFQYQKQKFREIAEVVVCASLQVTWNQGHWTCWLPPESMLGRCPYDTQSRWTPKDPSRNSKVCIWPMDDRFSKTQTLILAEGCFQVHITLLTVEVFFEHPNG